MAKNKKKHISPASLRLRTSYSATASFQDRISAESSQISA
jgi:hypothetical protein